MELRGQYSRESRPRDANVRMPLLTGTSATSAPSASSARTSSATGAASSPRTLTWVTGGHCSSWALEYNHVCADAEVRVRPVRHLPDLRAPRRRCSSCCRVGGPDANRFDAPSNVASYQRQIGNLETELTTDEFALFAQDAWKLTRDFTLNYGCAGRRRSTRRPTPTTSSCSTRCDGVNFPIGTDRRSRRPIPNQLEQFGPRVGFAWDPGATGRTVVRGYSGIYYARSPMLLFSDPMSNFRRARRATCRSRLPFAVPAGNPNTTLLRSAAADRHRPEPHPAGRAAAAHAGAADADRHGARPHAEPVPRRAGARGRPGFQEPARLPGRRRRRARAGPTTSASPRMSSTSKTEFLQRNRDLNLGVPVPRATDPAQRPIFPARPLSTLASVQVRESTAARNTRR